MNFTEQQLKNFVAYERVRQGGRYNMFDPGAMRATGLTSWSLIIKEKWYE